jgi:hypothetical protein
MSVAAWWVTVWLIALRAPAICQCLTSRAVRLTVSTPSWKNLNKKLLCSQQPNGKMSLGPPPWTFHTDDLLLVVSMMEWSSALDQHARSNQISIQLWKKKNGGWRKTVVAHQVLWSWGGSSGVPTLLLNWVIICCWMVIIGINLGLIAGDMGGIQW